MCSEVERRTLYERCSHSPDWLIFTNFFLSKPGNCSNACERALITSKRTWSAYPLKVSSELVDSVTYCDSFHSQAEKATCSIPQRDSNICT